MKLEVGAQSDTGVGPAASRSAGEDARAAGDGERLLDVPDADCRVDDAVTFCQRKFQFALVGDNPRDRVGKGLGDLALAPWLADPMQEGVGLRQRSQSRRRAD